VDRDVSDEQGQSGPTWLDTAQLAAFMSWRSPATVRRALWVTRRKIDYGVTLGARDLPEPDAYVGRSPRWRIESATTFRTGYRTLEPVRAVRITRRMVQSLPVAQVAPRDVIVHEDGRLEHVIDVRPAEDRVRLLVRARRRDAGRWLVHPPDVELPIFRPPPEQ